MFYTGSSTRLDVAVRRADGSVIRRIRRAGDPPPVTDEHVEAALAERLAGAPAAAAPQLRSMHEAMIFPEYHPAHGELLPDRAGNLWVRRLDAMEEAFPTWGVPARRTRWDVFDPGGAWLGVVAMPPRFRPEAIGRDRVAGIWMDGLDVEYVRV